MRIKYLLFFLLFIFLCFPLFSQTIGSKVSFKGTDGKTYTGTINDIRGDQFKIKYDGFDYEAWAAANQFTVISIPAYTTTSNKNNTIIGSKVSFKGTDGRTYSGTVNDIRGDQYKIKYDGYDFEAWTVKEQFTVVSTTELPAYSNTQQAAIYKPANSGTGKPQDLKSIFGFGKQQGWASVVHETRFNNYLAALSAKDASSVSALINQANTSSAKFFALKSLISGDTYKETQQFIQQMNVYPESYQQDKCLVSTKHSIIQQWQQTCSVTTIQTFLGDLCPRYVWEIKQIPNYDAVANDPNHPMARQQKELLEQYGGSVSARGVDGGKDIGIIEPLNQLVGRILGVNFTFEQITDLTFALSKVRRQLDRGIDVPLNIKFVGTEARHFILVMRYRNTQSGYQYQIYDPWDGVCDYVSESNLLLGSLAPLNNQWRISVDYWYPAQ